MLYVTLVGNMGAHGYYSAMKHAKVMVGNSSSGVIEAASFGLAVINVGDRQKGREVSPNVIQTKTDSASILEGLRKAADARIPTRVHKGRECLWRRAGGGPHQSWIDKVFRTLALMCVNHFIWAEVMMGVHKKVVILWRRRPWPRNC